MKGMNSFPWCFPKADISLVGKLWRRFKVRILREKSSCYKQCLLLFHQPLTLASWLLPLLKIPLTFFIPSLLCLGTCPSQPFLLFFFFKLIVCVLCSIVSDSLQAYQASLSMEFSRQGYWSRLPLPTPGDLPDPGIEPTSLCLLHWQVDSLPLCHLGSP